MDLLKQALEQKQGVYADKAIETILKTGFGLTREEAKNLLEKNSLFISNHIKACVEREDEEPQAPKYFTEFVNSLNEKELKVLSLIHLQSSMVESMKMMAKLADLQTMFESIIK